jgi:YegS/Rv2252/BmrU family lipid kinase
MNWWVIVNPSAGRPEELVPRVRQVLASHQIHAEIHESANPGHVNEIVAAGQSAGVRRFAGVGGDGTAHLLLNALMALEWDAPPGLAILPAGSGSDFIRTFGLPRSIDGAAAHLATPEWYTADVLEVVGEFGRVFSLNAVEAGVGAAAVGTAARMPRWIGERRYAIAFWLTLPRFGWAEAEVTVDERRSISGKAIEIVVANGQFFGGGMNIAPRASVADGKADVQVFAGPRRKAFSIMPRVIRGMHLSHRNVQRLAGKSIKIRVPADWPIEADGELIGHGPISVTVLPAAIQFKI